MVELHGIPVSPGVAIGPALVLDDEGYRIPRCHVAADSVDDEWASLQSASRRVATQLENNRLETARKIGASAGEIFSAQQQMLQDPRLRDELRRRILAHQQSAPYAVSRVFHHYAQALRGLSDSLLAERADDILDVERQLLQELGAITANPLGNLDGPVIVLSHNLTPSETAGLDRRWVRGFCTEVGGPSGHTAIVAKGLELPAVVGVGSLLDRIGGGTEVIVDGDRGIVVLDPDQETIENYRRRLQNQASLARRLAQLRDQPAVTADGVRVQLSANIEFPHEAATCAERGADGIGLYRTEFLYLGSAVEPTEEDHYNAYSQVVQTIGDRPVVIRTLDLGADKMGQRPLSEQEHNPCLGLRSIRLSLRNQDLFRTQLRAVLRAAVHGDVRLMFPLITTLPELRRARMLVNVVADDLREENIPHRADIPIGMMVEVPAAVLMLDRFVREVDFLSIGTNDLVQYTLAVDRSNEGVAELYQSSDPAVLRLIQTTINIAAAHDVPVSVCGEMSNSPARTFLLLGLGMRSLSVPPQAIPNIKKALSDVTIKQCCEIAARVMELESAREVEAYLNERLSHIAPELIVT